MLFLLSLQHTGRGDDTIREALYNLRDLLGYTHLFRLDVNMIYIPNLDIESGEMCSCKEFIAQELLKALLSLEVTDQEPQNTLRLLQHNIRFLLQNTVRREAGEHCLKDKIMVSMTRYRNDQQLIFIRRWITFFQAWVYKCITDSDV